MNYLHLIVSFLISWGIYKTRGNILSAMLIALGIGVLKELYDYWSYGLFSLEDLGYDLVGVLCAGLFFIIGCRRRL